MKCTWQEGNRITLLENGDNYYPAVLRRLATHSRKSFWKRLSGLKMTWAGSCIAHCCMPLVAV